MQEVFVCVHEFVQHLEIQCMRTYYQGWQNIDCSGTWEIPVIPGMGNTLKISKIGKYWEILDEIY